MIDVKNHIAEQIKRRRMSASITQQEMADYLGLCRVTFVNLENGRQGATSETLWLICNALNCTPNGLFPPGKTVKTKTVWVERTVKVKRKVRVNTLTPVKTKKHEK